MEPFFGSGRGVTTDNYFTSVSTAESLLKKKITMKGTLRVKNLDVPAMMETAEGRELLSSKFIFSDNIAVVSYVPKKNETVRISIPFGLGKELTQPNILRRARNTIGLQLPVLRAIGATGAFVVGKTAEKSIPTTSGQQQSRKRGRCYYCPRKNDWKVNSICCECIRFVCEKQNAE
ncbi:hypothetical protein J437_LFUL018606 [Ladona fulva]|uniref:PiggyBac transposable element-derived protein domain-containing protein n=1 Tax=Ladona fulva TaxID=123851 RepID=A0A8K0KVB9_LADFU|nr:hypothetical protein J437_LFUL018606 [Ladona fulva]